MFHHQVSQRKEPLDPVKVKQSPVKAAQRHGATRSTEISSQAFSRTFQK
jgi:hypothetical protein